MYSASQRIFQVYAVLLIGVMPLLATPWREEPVFDVKLVFAILITLIMATIVMANNIGFKIMPLSLIDWLIIAYAALIVISTVFSEYTRLSIKGLPNNREGLVSLLCYAAVYFFFSRFAIWNQRMMDFILLFASLISVYAILEFIRVIPPLRPGNFSATFGNRNFTGTYGTVMLPLAVWSLISRKKLRYGICSLLIFTLLLTSLTRSAWVALLIWIPLLIALTWKDKKGLNLLILFIISAAALSLILNNMTGHEISHKVFSILFDLNAPLVDEAGSARMHIWKNSIKLLADRPLLGSGPDTFGNEFFKLNGISEEMRKLPYYKAHNELLQIGVTTGVPALMAYLAVVALALGNGFRKVRRDPWMAPVLCALAGYLTQAVFNISVITTAPIFWAFLGLTAAKEPNVLRQPRMPIG